MTVKRSTYRINKDGWWALKEILANGEEFNPDLSQTYSRGFAKFTGTLRGRKVNEGAGRLPQPFRRQFLESAVTYIVYSYETPIAWRTQNGEWHTPNTKYSVTTSKHQGNVFTAISQL